MKQLRHFALTVLVALVGSLSASAHDFEAVNEGSTIYYNITSYEDLTCEVSYCVYYSSVYYEYSGSVVIPSSVEYNGKTYSVTSIGFHAFYLCSGLTSVNIPNSVTSIGDGAFIFCSGLTSINIPNSVTSIGKAAFSDCSGLTSVNIPNSVTSIGESVFAWCSGLTSITIPNSVTSIGESAFVCCSGLTSINIPNSVTSIGSVAFSGCSGLTSVTIPNSVTSIGSGAFSGCNKLESFDCKFASEDNRFLIIDGVLNSFAPSGLTSYSIPNSVTSIGSSAFSGCSGLTSINIPNSVTSIGSSAFSGCSGLTSINIPNSVTEVGYGTFWGCSGLTSINIPNGVTSIGIYAFSDCIGLTSVNIPNGVTSIGDLAFYNCSGLKEITSMAVTPPSISYDTFAGVSKTEAVVKVPDESVDAYKAAEYWNEFSNYIGLNSGSGQDTKKCEAPTIVLIDGMLVATSETEGAVCNTTITPEDNISYVGNEPIKLSGVYKVTSFATAEGYENSETVTMLLYWSKPSFDGETEMTLVGDLNGDGKVNIADLNLVIDIMSER